MSAERPLCFVLMPFGIKRDPVSLCDINFDAIYDQGIRPGVENAGLEPIRADEERTGGIIHKPMFERLLLCDYAVADLTSGNANVYYELGVRHATRPSTTLAIFADNQRLPFDLNFLRSLPYKMGEGCRFGKAEASDLAEKLTARLMDLRQVSIAQAAADSPFFQLLTEYKAPEIAHLKTDVFRNRVDYSVGVKRKLARARESSDANAVLEVESAIPDLEGVEAGVVVDLFLTWRALSRWDRMLSLYERIPAVLKRSVMMREQYAFALNRSGARGDALQVLEAVLSDQGPSSETYGLIGRIYKDQWADGVKKGEKRLAVGYLDKAINAYVRGFESDFRDAYPGINAVTLLEIRGDETSLRRKAEILPVVRYAVLQRLKGSKPDYWDYATLLELAVLDNNEEQVFQYLSDALANVRENWEPQTTANNLRMIQTARRERSSEPEWLDEAIASLDRRAAGSS